MNLVTLVRPSHRPSPEIGDVELPNVFHYHSVAQCVGALRVATRHKQPMSEQVIVGAVDIVTQLALSKKYRWEAIEEARPTSAFVATYK